MAHLVRVLLLIAALCLTAAPASAVKPDEILDDPKLEERAREISRDLRCLVCQNQSIDDSNAPLARDLRLLVRERLKAGDTNAEVIDFVVKRYGEFVLLQPRFAPHTLALWLGTPILLLLSVFFLYRAYKRQRVENPPPARLSTKEKRKLRKFLDTG